jgi:hypothetical protein
VLDPLVVGVLFPRRQGAGAALRAGRLVVLARDRDGAETPLTLTCLARPGGRGPARPCRYEHSTAITVTAREQPVATFDPVRGRLWPAPTADASLVAATAEALRGLGPIVQPPAPPPVSAVPPHLQVAG